MLAVSSGPVQALALLPLDQSALIERQWLQDTLAWLKSVPPDARTERLRQLAYGIGGASATRERFQRIWAGAFAPRLLSEAGLPEATSLFRELIGRLKRRLLPQLEDELDLYEALQSADLDEADAEWIAGLSETDIAPWRELVGACAGDIAVAIRLLALRAASIGLSRGVMKVMTHRDETESPFFDLVEAAGQFAHKPTHPEAFDRLRELVLQCRLSSGLSHARLEDLGVSSDLVFRLDLVLAQLERIDVLLRVAFDEEELNRFAAMLVRACNEERGLHNLVRNSVNRVARQIVTHTGKSGEHYIASSKSDWIRMGKGALGAGCITAFTALFKYVLAAMVLAPLWIGVAQSLNYTLSFILMQLLGFSLASKMPSMTAAALSDALENEDGMQSEVTLVAAITRTQAIVTAGNLLGAIPAAFLIDLAIQLTRGHPFLNEEAAVHGLHATHPLESLTMPFAVLTGCFLWLSSLFAGWTANWMVLHRFPAAIGQSRRIGRFLGARGALKLAQFVKHHLSGIAGYICLGLMLGLLPYISIFVGFPVEVRHITLASASVAYDVSSLARTGTLPWANIGWAILGLVSIGLLNFGVSFALGLWLALRARNLDARGRVRLLAALWNEIRRKPARFLWRYELGNSAPDSL